MGHNELRYIDTVYFSVYYCFLALSGSDGTFKSNWKGGKLAEGCRSDYPGISPFPLALLLNETRFRNEILSSTIAPLV